MSPSTVIAVMEHAAVVERDIEGVEAEMVVELENVVNWSLSVFGTAVEDTPHMAVLRDQLQLLNEEREACHLCMNV